jgi:hypothetical protein
VLRSSARDEGCYLTHKRRLKLNSVGLVRQRIIPTERPPLVGEVSATFFADGGCRVVSATDSHCR